VAPLGGDQNRGAQLSPVIQRDHGLVLATIDGKRNVRQIVDDVDASTFDVCKAIYQFINAGAVRRKSV